MDTALPATRTVILTESAARRIAALRLKRAEPGLNLRLTVSGGGCSGFRYEFAPDSAPAQTDDHVFARDGVALLVDTVSLDLLEGSEVDFVENLMGAYFEVRNPQATSGCGCGSSFSIA